MITITWSQHPLQSTTRYQKAPGSIVLSIGADGKSVIKCPSNFECASINSFELYGKDIYDQILFLINLLYIESKGIDGSFHGVIGESYNIVATELIPVKCISLMFFEGPIDFENTITKYEAIILNLPVDLPKN
jgi:hypothetical protein